jgi:hypothetical protein
MILPIICGLFPLRLKSDTFTTLFNFFSYVSTKFGSTIKNIQCDNGGEFDNSHTRSFLTHSVLLRMSCSYTSPQNDKFERIIRSTNNVMRSLLFQASLPACYWVESLHTTTFLLNRLPTKTISASCPYFALFGTTPTYEHLRVFCCICYLSMSATAPHKLAPRSARFVFLGYSDHHKGYRCLVIFRHVVFDEAVFPFATSPHPTDNLDFLLSGETPMVPPIGTPLLASPTVPRATTLELVPSSLEFAPPGTAPLTAPRAATLASTLTRQVALTVPPCFLPRAAPATLVAPRADLMAPAASYVTPTTPATSRAALVTPTSPS